MCVPASHRSYPYHHSRYHFQEQRWTVRERHVVRWLRAGHFVASFNSQYVKTNIDQNQGFAMISLSPRTHLRHLTEWKPTRKTVCNLAVFSSGNYKTGINLHLPKLDICCTQKWSQKLTKEPVVRGHWHMARNWVSWWLHIMLALSIVFFFHLVLWLHLLLLSHVYPILTLSINKYHYNQY